MKIAMVGVGAMGKTICHLLKKLSYEVHAFDVHSQCPPGVDCDAFHRFNSNTLYKGNPLQGEGFDLVFSALPYFCNDTVANLATAAGIPYFDLGGSVPVSREINRKYGDGRNATVFTDLGLAPGWVNIMAEEAYYKLAASGPGPVKEIKMRCGGLPGSAYSPADDPFSYSSTWSAEGLFNEYQDDCEVLEWGKIKTVPGLGGCENVSTKGAVLWQGSQFPLEAFFTSGGASHTIQLMKDRNVDWCSYKTLRYPGHRDLMHYFINVKKYKPSDLAKLFIHHPEGDIVILDVWGRIDNIEYRKSHIIRSDDTYSAMQKATAGGFVSAALSVDLSQKRSLTYKDVDIGMFNENIELLGVMK